MFLVQTQEQNHLTLIFLTHHVSRCNGQNQLDINHRIPSGLTYRYPANASAAGRFACVIVSPTRVSPTFLIDAAKNLHHLLLTRHVALFSV